MKKNKLNSHNYILLCIIIFTLFSCFIQQGCQKKAEPITISSFKLNTIVNITIYDSQDSDILNECLKICDKYENIFSRTKETSELYQLNQNISSNSSYTCTPSKALYELLSLGYMYYQETDGAFNIAIAPLTSLWDFTSETPVIPPTEELSFAVTQCSWDGVSFNEDDSITFNNCKTTFDLGALAKGYVADKIKEYLLSQNIKSAIINLGGNVLCIGTKPDKTPFKIGIQKPFADRNETIDTIDIKDCSVVSSGIYERYFEKNGTIYHHILDSTTGYPVKNNLISVTIISDTSTVGDYLSTACFSLGLEKGLDFANKQNVAAVFITDTYEIIYSEEYLKNYNN